MSLKKNDPFIICNLTNQLAHVDLHILGGPSFDLPAGQWVVVDLDPNRVPNVYHYEVFCWRAQGSRRVRSGHHDRPVGKLDSGPPSLASAPTPRVAEVPSTPSGVCLRDLRTARGAALRFVAEDGVEPLLDDVLEREPHHLQVVERRVQQRALRDQSDHLDAADARAEATKLGLHPLENPVERRRRKLPTVMLSSATFRVRSRAG